MTVSTRWKRLESYAADLLGGRRVIEDWTLFRRRPDVIVSDFRLVIDAKAFKHFSLHRHLDKVQSEYCTPGDVPCVVTREPGDAPAYITVPLAYFADLLNELRSARGARRTG